MPDNHVYPYLPSAQETVYPPPMVSLRDPYNKFFTEYFFFVGFLRLYMSFYNS